MCVLAVGAEDVPYVWNVPPANSFFVGRESQLAELKKLLNGHEKTVALVGAAGFGKTQLAKRYAQMFHTDFDIVWWFNGEENLDQELEAFAEKLNMILPQEKRLDVKKLSKDSLLLAVKELLRLEKLRWLLIFDNVTSYGKVKSFIPTLHSGGKGQVIITSRNPTVYPVQIFLQKFDRSESLKLISRLSTSMTEDDAEQLSRLLDDFPLALAVSVTYLQKHPGLSVDRYATLLKENAQKVNEETVICLQEEGAVTDFYATTLDRTLRVSLSRLFEKEGSSINLLGVLLAFSSKNVLWSYIEHWVDVEGKGAFASDLIRPFYEQSLLEIENDSVKHINPVCHFHDLIHEALRRIIFHEKAPVFLEAASRILLPFFSGTYGMQITEKLIAQPLHVVHAEELSSVAKSYNFRNHDLLRIRIGLFEYFTGGIRAFRKATHMRSIIDEDIEEIGFPDKKYQAIYKINKALLEALSQANYTKVIADFKEALALLDEKEQPDETLRVLTNIAQFSFLRGDLEASENYFLLAKPVFERCTSSLSRFFHLVVYVHLCIEQGRFEEAKKTMVQAEEFLESTLNYPTFHFALLMYRIEILLKRGELEEAERSIDVFSRKIHDFFGKTPNTFEAHRVLLSCFLSVLKKEGTLALSKKVQELIQEITFLNTFYGGEEKHKNQAFSYLVLGMMYEEIGALEEALSAYKKSENIFKNLYTKESTDNMSRLFFLLARLGGKTNDEVMSHHYFQKHIDSFGLDHPRTREMVIFFTKRSLPIPW